MRELPELPSRLDPTAYWICDATEVDKSELWNLENLLGRARSEVVKFRSCIALADVGFHNLKASLEKNTGSLDGDIFGHWPQIAAHSAIGALYQFNDLLSAVETWGDSAGAARLLANPKGANATRMLFEKNFPKWKQSRHATAHTAEIGLDFDRNAFAAPLNDGFIKKPRGTTMMIQDSFQDRTFVTTRRGELLRFDVTWENYLRFRDVYSLLAAEMKPAAAQPA